VNDATLRLFFALWPDTATRSALDHAAANLHDAWGGRRMRADSLHLTLAFLGATPTAKLDAVKDAAGSVGVAGFTITLDRYACWQHNRIGWLGAQQVPTALTQLADVLALALCERELTVDAKPFVPHVTVLRNTACADASAIAPVVWRAQDFALVASPGADAAEGYRVLARWPLLEPGNACT
jgi:2'-5' RNA ligase